MHPEICHKFTNLLTYYILCGHIAACYNQIKGSYFQIPQIVIVNFSFYQKSIP